MDIEIVPMAEKHIKDIAEIERQCFSSPWTEEGLREELSNPNSHFLVSEEDGRAAGYIGVQEICDEAYITNVAVLPAYRKKGMGTLLVEKASEGAKSRECEFITLEVRVSNATAIGLYENCGFTEAGRRKNFYSKPQEDALLMTKYFKR